ncbi:MAG: DUF1501 domain-containing protein [Ignavibacteria bacterium]|nr:DUF1501 domain-containing protein [Ignavibacteria bacterium]
MNRRQLIKSLLSASVALPGVLSTPIKTFAAPYSGIARIAAPPNQGNRILVVVRMFGGNDGLNTIVPYASDEYYRVRKVEALRDMSIAAETVIKIDGLKDHGFHPSLSPLAELYSEGKVAVIQGVGYPNMNLSHFRGADIWLSASDASNFEHSGWMGRMLEFTHGGSRPAYGADPYAIEMGDVLGYALAGQNSMYGHRMTIGQSEFTKKIPVFDGSDDSAVLEYNLAQIMREGNSNIISIEAALDRAKTNTQPYDASPIASYLKTVSRCIRGGLETQLYVLHSGMFDTHHRQQQVHTQQLDEFFRNIHDFQRELEESGDDTRVVIMPISEFGRRVDPTESGTDHGTAAPVFVIGSEVNGGIYGTAPSLTDLDIDDNLRWEIDFRQIYNSILSQWFLINPADSERLLLPRRFDELPLFGRASSVNQINAAGKSVAYPMPCSDKCRITIALEKGEQHQVLATNAQGRTFAIPSIAETEALALDTSSLAAGLYNLTLRTSAGRIHNSLCVVDR